MKKSLRLIVYNKFDGKCGYTGTPLKDDWQVDHIKPLCLETNNSISNLIPAQRIVNHYKRSLSLELFRVWYLGGLHLRLKKLPRNPTNPKSIKKKEYLTEVASLFNITEDKPFSGVFYFETLL